MTEAQLQATVIAVAQSYGWLVHHVLPSMNKQGVWATHELGDHGFPDLVLAHPSGRVIFAELKSEKGKLSPLQFRWLNALNKSTGAYLWRPSDLPLITKLLETK
jgi:hypothetical protein